MSAGFAYEVSRRLVDAGGFVWATDLFVGRKAVVPKKGDEQYALGFLVVVETGGGGNMRTHGGSSIQRPTAQLAVTAESAQVARARLAEAYAALGGDDGLYNIRLPGIGEPGPGTFYQQLLARQGATDIGPAPDGGAMFAFNIEAMKAPS